MFSKLKIIAIFVLLLFGLQCKKNKVTDDTYFGSKVMILGHRGGMGVWYKLPGDVYETIPIACGIGEDGCEIDTYLTKDSVLVLFHDYTLDDKTSCTGKIIDHTWAELKTCKYTAIKDDIYICSVEDVFSKLPNLQGFYFSFDIQLDDNVPNVDEYRNIYVRQLKKIFDKYNMVNNVLVEAPREFLKKCKTMGIQNKLFMANALTQANIDTAVKYSFQGLSSQMDDFAVSASVAHEKGLYVMGYSPYNYYQNIDAVKKGVDILQTDDPISILKHFNRYNYDYVIP